MVTLNITRVIDVKSIIRMIDVNLFCCNELVEESCVVLREHTEVGNTILQVGDALDTKTKGIACVNLAIDAASLKHIGVYHATAKDFHPTSVLAEATTLAATDMARDVHLGTWLCEREVAWTQTNLCVRTKQLASEGQEHLLEVGERHILVYIQALKLMEEAVGTCRDSLVAIYSTRANHADRRLLMLHDAALVV